jgi:hypothetical protein
MPAAIRFPRRSEWSNDAPPSPARGPPCPRTNSSSSPATASAPR